jgi:hypothetical protein
MSIETKVRRLFLDTIELTQAVKRLERKLKAPAKVVR